MILLSTRTVRLWVPRDDGECSSLKWARNYFLRHHHPAMSLEAVVKTRLILREEFIVPLLGQGCPGLKWMFSEPDLLQRVVPFHLRLGI